MGQFEAATIRPQLSFSFPTGPFLHSFRVADNPGTTLIREALLPGCPSSDHDRGLTLPKLANPLDFAFSYRIYLR